MTTEQTYNEDQRARWNGLDGEYWAEHQDRLDRTLSPVTAPLIEFASPAQGATVIDVGCGCGATTLAIARVVGPSGRVIGADISGPMVERAKQRSRELPNVSYLLGDAAAMPLSEIGADLIVSRFGIMFFGDPAAAFSNLRTALAPGGRIRFACWRSVHENPWLQVPLHAVYEHAPRLPKPDPEEPGPFSFSDPDRVTRILTAAGFTTPVFKPLDIEMDIAAGGDLDEAVAQASDMGPAKRALADQPDDIRAKAIESIRRVLAPHASAGGGVKLAGGVWLVAAEKSL